MTQVEHGPRSTAGGEGLRSSSPGLWGSTVMGLASTAPACSLAATPGYVVLAVGDRSPAMLILAFLPTAFTAVAYREPSRGSPDHGCTTSGPLGGVFVIGVGMLVLGVPLTPPCWCPTRTR